MSQIEIKFRYTCIRENDFVFSDIFTLEEIENGQVYQWMTANHVTGKVIKDRYTVLKDKNGLEIYEGDIVKCGFRNHGIAITYINQAVSFENGTFTVKSDNVEFEESLRNVPIHWVDEIEIIGNIHNNPELL